MPSFFTDHKKIFPSSPAVTRSALSLYVLYNAAFTDFSEAYEANKFIRSMSMKKQMSIQIYAKQY